MIVTIKRQESPFSDPYYQSFNYDGDQNVTVAAVLDALNYTDDLYDVDGNSAPRIHWACSCMQNICGACAMVINGVPALACNTFLRDIKGDRLLLEPLTKFPTVIDLIVDRIIIKKSLNEAKIFIGEFEKSNPKEYEQIYSVAKCLRCGLCLEVCPNYTKGESFFGALFANQSLLTYSQSKDRKKELLKAYNEHFSNGCSKSLSCQKVCPVGISTLSSMLKMNRQTYK